MTCNKERLEFQIFMSVPGILWTLNTGRRKLCVVVYRIEVFFLFSDTCSLLRRKPVKLTLVKRKPHKTEKKNTKIRRMDYGRHRRLAIESPPPGEVSGSAHQQKILHRGLTTLPARN